MPNYRLFSRRNGYAGGHPCKYFHSELIADNCNNTKQFVDMSGKAILNIIDEIKNSAIKNKVKQFVKMYPTWYYYPDKTKITDNRIFNL